MLAAAYAHPEPSLPRVAQRGAHVARAAAAGNDRRPAIDPVVLCAASTLSLAWATTAADSPSAPVMINRPTGTHHSTASSWPASVVTKRPSDRPLGRRPVRLRMVS